jgi:predicted amidohydrolase
MNRRPVFAAAQTSPTRYNYHANLNDHYRFIELAAKNGAGLIVFPEMSITGYEREKANEARFTMNDERLYKLNELSAAYDITIIAGAPVIVHDKLYIGSFIYKPNGSVSLYTKHFLHPGEEIAFIPSMEYDPLLVAGDETVSLAVCADIDHIEHSEAAAAKKTSLYIASIFFSPGGIPDAYAKLSTYAADYSMHVLMANFCGQSWGSYAGGKSAFWDMNGNLVQSLGPDKPGLLLVKKMNSSWESEIIV